MIELRPRFHFKRVSSNIVNDADDRPPSLVAQCPLDAPADCIFSRKKLSRECLVDNCDERFVTSISFVEIATAHKAHTHRIQITGRDYTVLSERFLPTRHRLSAFDEEVVHALITRHRQTRGCSNSVYTGQALQSRLSLHVKLLALCVIRVTCPGQRNLKRRYTLRFESRIDRHQPLKTLQHQHGANQQHRNQSNLHAHENAMRPTPRARGTNRRGALECFDEV